MTRQHVARTPQSSKSETPLVSALLPRAAVCSIPETAMQPQEDTENSTSRESRFHHDFSRVPVHSTTPIIQPQLRIGAVGDKYEQEADRVARQVVNQIHAPGNQTVQREAMPDKEDEQSKLMVQRQSDGGAMAATPQLEASIQQARGNGHPLTDNIRKPMERSFGFDFSHVKVHTDAQSERLNRSIQAKAFTTGQDIFFRQGAYSPGSRGGQELIAHELTHVVQQNGSTMQRTQSQTENDAADYVVEKPAPRRGIAKVIRLPLIQRVGEGEVDTIMEQAPELAAHFEQWSQKGSSDQTQSAEVVESTKRAIWLKLQDLARKENKTDPKAVIRQWDLSTATEKIRAAAAKYTLEQQKRAAESREADTQQLLYKEGKLDSLTVPGIGKASVETYFSNKDKLLFMAHGFTKKRHIQSMLDVMASWEDDKVIGFMRNEFQTLLRTGGEKGYPHELKELAKQLDSAKQELKTKGIDDAVVAPHHPADVMEKELPDLVNQLKDVYDIAILRDWEWDIQTLREVQSDTSHPSPPEIAYIGSVPLHLLLSNQPLQRYGKVLLRVCRTGWSTQASEGMGGASTARMNPASELQPAHWRD